MDDDHAAAPAAQQPGRSSIKSHRRWKTHALETTGLLSRARERGDVQSLALPTEPPSIRAALGELGGGAAAARLAAAAPRLLRVPRGDGRLVVDIPGYLAPEVSAAPMRAYLKALGHDARGWGLGTNTRDPHKDIEEVARVVLDLADEVGAPVSLVGWSLGGLIAREVARRQPEAVQRVITYGTPLVGGARFTVFARAYGPEVSAAADELARTLDTQSPIRVPVTAVFSRRDGIVAWEACIDRSSPVVEHVEVRSTHVGMGFDPDVWTIIAERLATRAVAKVA